MRVVVQRVKNAKVTVDNSITGEIGRGILIYLGITHGDTEKDIDWLINKIPNLRIFSDDSGKMNHSVVDLDYGILVISQFTLMANCKKGRRPSYDGAAKPEIAKKMYDTFVKKLKDIQIKVETGVFRAHMDVEYINDGPVTIIVDSKG